MIRNDRLQHGLNVREQQDSKLVRGEARMGRRQWMSYASALAGGSLLSACGGGDGVEIPLGERLYANSTTDLTTYSLIGNGFSNGNLIYRGDGQGFAVLPPGAEYGSTNGQVNKGLIHFRNAARPQHLSFNNNRMTIAMDICFNNGYLFPEHVISNPPYQHMGLVARHKGVDYVTKGDNRAACVYLGHMWGGSGTAAFEEIQIFPNFGDNNLSVTQGVVTENRWYRIAIDSIVYGGDVGHEVRIWDRSSGMVQIWRAPLGSGTHWSSYSGNYDLNSSLVSLFSLASVGEFYFTNLKTYWCPPTQWVETP